MCYYVCYLLFSVGKAVVKNSQVCVKKVVKKCINILHYKNVVPFFITEINCKLRSREFIKFFYL